MGDRGGGHWRGQERHLRTEERPVRITRDKPKQIEVGRRKLKVRNLDEKQVSNEDLKVFIK